MNESGKIFDDIGRLMNEAAGVAEGMRREVETAVRSQMERVVNDLDLVKREDYDALREMVLKQDAEIKTLQKELAAFKTTRKKTTS